MPRFDIRCQRCNHEWAASKAFDAEIACPECGSIATTTLMPRVQGIDKAKDPFDLVHGGMSLPGSKKIKSYGNDRRKGGKDST